MPWDVFVHQNKKRISAIWDSPKKNSAFSVTSGQEVIWLDKIILLANFKPTTEGFDAASTHGF